VQGSINSESLGNKVLIWKNGITITGKDGAVLFDEKTCHFFNQKKLKELYASYFDVSYPTVFGPSEGALDFPSEAKGSWRL